MFFCWLPSACWQVAVLPHCTARLYEEFVDGPEVQVFPGDDRAVVAVEVERPSAVRVQDVDEAGVVAVEEVLGHVVVGTGDLGMRKEGKKKKISQLLLAQFGQ